MFAKMMKGAIRRTVAQLGYEIRRSEPRPAAADPAPAAAPVPPEEHGIGSIEVFLRYLRTRGFRPKCVLDVGASTGYWAWKAAAVFPDSRFVLVEPQEEMKPGLAVFTAAHPTTRVIHAGAGAEAGNALQTIWPDLYGSSFAFPRDEVQVADGRQRVTPIVTIDEVFANELVLPELVKLDVQGYELEVLKGAKRLFGRTECFILEVDLFGNGPSWPDMYAVQDFMRERGYRVFDVCGYWRDPETALLRQVDLAFARADGPFVRR